MTGGETWAPYMRWAKARLPARFDLAGSNLAPCPMALLTGWQGRLEANASNPDGWPPLVEAIAARYGTTTDRVATGQGCTGANFLAFAALVRPGDRVVVERPGYDPLVGALRLLGAEVVRFDRTWEDRWAVDPDRVRHAAGSRAALIVLTSPHNPSGVLVPGGTLDAVGEVARQVGARVLVDEVYLDSVFRGPHRPAALQDEVFISTNSLTKSYGLPGLRCGWVLAAPEIRRAILSVRDVVEVNGAVPAEQLATIAFDELDRIAARARGILDANRARLGTFMASRTDLEWVPPDGGTIAFPLVRGQTDTTVLVARLQEHHGIAVVPGAFFDAPRHIRLAFGGDPAMVEQALEALRGALDS